jgi:hypothetical protein
MLKPADMRLRGGTNGAGEASSRCRETSDTSGWQRILFRRRLNSTVM